MLPQYNLDKIKFATDRPTFERAVGLYESGKVTKFKVMINGFSAIVQGTKPYRVIVGSRNYDEGDCECYLGQNDTLCKHMVAVAIHAVMGGKELNSEDKELVDRPRCSDRLGVLTKEELTETKAVITVAMRYIKPYNGPSRIWFAYQNSLDEGCNRLSSIVSGLPVSKQTTDLLINLLLRLDKKLSQGGVDDSNGTVGGFIQETVFVLKEYGKLDPICINSFNKLANFETCFGWEEELVKMVKN